MPEVTRSSVRGLVPVGFGTGRAKAARADPALSSESRGKVRRLGGRLRLQAVDKKDLRCYPFGQQRDINFKKDSEVGSACRPPCACGTLGRVHPRGSSAGCPSRGAGARRLGVCRVRGVCRVPRRGLGGPRRAAADSTGPDATTRLWTCRVRGPGVSVAC